MTQRKVGRGKGREAGKYEERGGGGGVGRERKGGQLKERDLKEGETEFMVKE